MKKGKRFIITIHVLKIGPLIEENFRRRSGGIVFSMAICLEASTSAYEGVLAAVVAACVSTRMNACSYTIRVVHYRNNIIHIYTSYELYSMYVLMYVCTVCMYSM